MEIHGWFIKGMTMFFKKKKSKDIVAVLYNQGFVLIDKTKLLESDPKNSKFYVILSSQHHENGIVEKKYHFIKLKYFKNSDFKKTIDNSVVLIGEAIPEYFENGEFTRGTSKTVVQRIKSLKYPKGGLIGIRKFTEEFINDDKTFLDHNIGNVRSGLMGNTIECLAKTEQGIDIEKAFLNSYKGAYRLSREEDAFEKLKIMENSTNRSSEYLNAAFNLGRYIPVYRGLFFYDKEAPDLEVDNESIKHINIMLDRCKKFFDHYGEIVLDGFSFDGAYTNKIGIGEGDFTTHDTLWDMKVSSRKFNPTEALQILVYYIMGKEAKLKGFENIEYLGIFNPRLNKVWRVKIEDLSDQLIEDVSKIVIGYEE